MSSNSKRELFLVQTNGGMKIPIINGGQIILGRSRLTKIKDKRLSKHHLKLVSTVTKNTLSIQHIGKNSSTVIDYHIIYISPEGRKFKCESEVYSYISNCNSNVPIDVRKMNFINSTFVS